MAELCRQGQFDAAQHELYSKDCKSTEPEGNMSGFPKEVQGLDAIVEKGKHFQKMVEAVHSIKVSDPIVAGNAFAFTLDMDITMTGQGRQKMTEVSVYQTRDGKVVAEQFYW